MKRKIQFAALVCGILAASLLATACQPQTVEVTREVVVTQQVEVPVEVTRVVEVEAPTAEPAAPQEAPLELAHPGELTIGFAPNPGVFELTESGEATGAFGVMITEIARRLGLKPVYVPLAFPALIPAVQSHRIDLNSAGFSVTQPRAQIFYYGVPWLFGAETLAVLPGTEIPSWEYAAENGLTLATGVGYYYVGIWEEMGINLHTFDSDDACFLDVVNGGAAGCAVGVFTHAVRKITAPDSPGAQLVSIVTTGPRVTADLNAVAVAKDSPSLGRTLIREVTKLHREGFVEKATCDALQNAPECQLFLQPPPGHGIYVPGPWEVDTVPVASEVYPQDLTTVSAGELTVGVAPDSATLQLSGDQLSGPEAAILQFAADKLGLTLKGVAVDDPTAAIRAGEVDLIAGSLAATEELSHQYWQTLPLGFNPDYIYVAPGEGGGFPSYTSWETILAADGTIAIASDNPRKADLEAAGMTILEVDDAAAGLQALLDGTAQGFVGTTLDYAAATSANPDLANAGLGWVRNVNSYSYGEAYVWGLKDGSGDLIDALNQALTAAWQQGVVAGAYAEAFPGANTSALLAPGPTAIGTSFGASRDFVFRNMWVPGPWAQRPGWVE